MNFHFCKIFLLLLVICQFSIPAHSQEAKQIDRTSVESKFYYGFILKHRASLGYYIKGHVPAFEINVNLKTDGSKIYHQVFRYPVSGFGYYFANLGNRKILGQVHAAYLFMNIPIIKKENFSFNYRLAAGMSYLTKCFDISENYFNTAIGSHFNIYINLGLNLKFNLNQRLSFSTGLSMVHYSNGALKMPNLGINVVSVDLGLQYKLSHKIPDSKHIDLPAFIRKNEFSVIYSNGFKEVSQPGGKKFYSYDICLNFDRLINYKRKLGCGLDFFNDISIYQQYRNDFKIAGPMDVFRAGTHLSTDLIFDKLCLTIQQGVYVYQRYTKDGYLYSRYGLKYFAGDHFIVNLSLKTHLVKADLIEFGIGFRL